MHDIATRIQKESNPVQVGWGFAPNVSYEESARVWGGVMIYPRKQPIPHWASTVPARNQRVLAAACTYS